MIQQALKQQRLRSALEVQRSENISVTESHLRVELEKPCDELKTQCVYVVSFQPQLSLNK